MSEKDRSCGQVQGQLRKVHVLLAESRHNVIAWPASVSSVCAGVGRHQRPSLDTKPLTISHGATNWRTGGATMKRFGVWLATTQNER
jgi:hypothetical protein